MRTLEKDCLKVKIFNSREELGEAAATEIAVELHRLLRTKETVNVIFAAAPSQNETLAALCRKDIPWERVNGFHMDEYCGLPAGSPQSFERYLREHIFDRVPFGNVSYIGAYGERYEELIRQTPIDVVCMGIGENGHIAFNDPGEADFHDPRLLKRVQLDEVCRMQQVHDGCFATLDEVPKEAYSLTVPALMSAGRLFCMVPGETKRNAVRRTVYDPVSEAVPATALRLHPAATLYCDRDSGRDL